MTLVSEGPRIDGIKRSSITRITRTSRVLSDLPLGNDKGPAVLEHQKGRTPLQVGHPDTEQSP